MKRLLSLSAILPILLSAIVALTPYAAFAAPRTGSPLAMQSAALASPDDACPTAKQIIYVEEGGSGDGSSWSSPYSELQEALAAASDTATYSYEIWVATGGYKPGTQPYDTFQLKNCVALYGGFSGTEEHRDGRNPEPSTNGTVLLGTRWVHVAVTLDDSIGMIYVNGTPASSDAVSYAPQDVVGPNMWLGRSQFLVDPYFDGKLDEVAVYDRALSASEIDDIYTSGWWGVSGKVVALYLDESPAHDGTILADISGEKNHGSLATTDSEDKASTGYRNGAVELDGTDDYVDLPDMLASASEFSFVAWVAWDGGGAWQRIFDFGHDTNDYMFLTPRSNADTLRFAWRDGGGSEEIVEWSDPLPVAAANYHVVTGSGVDASAVLDGFTVTGGAADEPWAAGGGGMFNESGNPTVANVTFIGNSAWEGGGMHNYESSPTLANVTFAGNAAIYDGGGMQNMSSSPTLVNVTFEKNSSGQGGGGGMSNLGSDPSLINAIFSGNYSSLDGAGMSNIESNPTLISVTFSGNYGSDRGGAMHNLRSNPSIQNSILWGNKDDNGTGTASSAIYNDSSSPNIAYSIVQGSGGSGSGWDTSLGTDGGHNLDSDPMFMRNPDLGDGSTWTKWDNDLGDLRLQEDSPAFDAGNAGFLPADSLDLDVDGDKAEPCPMDLDKRPRVAYDSVDMGAYEFPLKEVFLPVAIK